MLTPGHQRVYAGGNPHGQEGGQRQAGDVGHLLFFVAVVPALADDVDPQEGEDDKAQPVVPGGNVLVDGTRKQEAQHGHQELSRPGGHGKLDAVAQAFLLNEQAVGERHDKGVYGQGESPGITSRQAACSLRRGTLGHPPQKAIFLFHTVFPGSGCMGERRIGTFPMRDCPNAWKSVVERLFRFSSGDSPMQYYSFQMQKLLNNSLCVIGGSVNLALAVSFTPRCSNSTE